MNIYRAYINGMWRTVHTPREIRRGRNKGRIEVLVNNIKTVGESWKIVARPVILRANDIHGYGDAT